MSNLVYFFTFQINFEVVCTLPAFLEKNPIAGAFLYILGISWKICSLDRFVRDTTDYLYNNNVVYDKYPLN